MDLGERPLLLAPMEDVTDIGFRLLCRQMGAAMVYSEFVSCDALVRLVNKSLAKLRVCDDERPVAIQIYGRDPAAMRDAAQIVVERARPDVLDINFGCPVRKVAGKGSGSGLLRDVPLLLAITRAVADAVPGTPVTAKTRLAWDEDSLFLPDGRPFIVDLAERLQDSGAQALAIHGRTRAQMYTGRADWTLIGQVKRDPGVRIPIIGNGDVASSLDASRLFGLHGVDAVMIGRATFGQPWVFLPPHEAARLTPGDKLDILKRQVTISVERARELYAGDTRRDPELCGIMHARRHLAASPLFKGIPDFRATRVAMLRAATLTELFGIMESTRELLPDTQETSHNP